MKTADPGKYVRLRTALIGIVMGVFLGLVGAKAVYLQVIHDDWLSQKAASQYTKSLSARGRRGAIFDAKLGELALSIQVLSIGAYPAKMEDKGAAAAALAGALGIDPKPLRKRFEASKSFVWVKRHVTPKEINAIEKLTLQGIVFVDEHSRFYPYRTLAAQVLGFTGIDEKGLEGLEYYFDHRLRGAEKRLTVLKDALGREFDGERHRFTTAGGGNLVLTIDRRIQYLTEKALKASVEKYSAKSGMAIVMSPKTGAILAMAHHPFFNPNNYKDYDRENWRNRCLTDPFEPGSTMKIFSAAAALEYGGYTASSIFFCENGAYRIGRNVVHDTKEHGWLSLQQIVTYSSNIGAVKISEMVGMETLYKTLRSFGFGVKTGIHCPGESAGTLAPFRRWTQIDAGTIAFGQGLSATALQLVTAVSAIANDGVLMRPYIVQAITDPNGKLLESYTPKRIRRVVSVGTARTVAEMMKSVISEEGTGTNAALDGYTACGKTGTAQKIGEGGRYARDKYIASFVGFAPAENPQVAILVVVDEPKKKHYGGTVAAPAFREIAHGALDYLNVPPTGGIEKLLANADSGGGT